MASNTTSTQSSSQSAALAARNAALADFAAEFPEANIRSQAILEPQRLVGGYFPEPGAFDYGGFEAHRTAHGTFRATRLG